MDSLGRIRRPLLRQKRSGRRARALNPAPTVNWGDLGALFALWCPGAGRAHVHIGEQGAKTRKGWVRSSRLWGWESRALGTEPVLLFPRTWGGAICDTAWTGTGNCREERGKGLLPCPGPQVCHSPWHRGGLSPSWTGRTGSQPVSQSLGPRAIWCLHISEELGHVPRASQEEGTCPQGVSGVRGTCPQGISGELGHIPTARRCSLRAGGFRPVSGVRG